ncbi:tyrosine-type recombinase/integrase [Nocardiopsis aegyptia]|uniref:tyrosine-type recombinase/integrase n=1 Tax=Nocardiopsis aegyptia TaxID=220378 RepID=UPI00366B1361
MASFRKLPSGKWQATVRDPSGKRHTHSDKLKSVVKAWASDQEAKFAAGDTRSPRAGEIRVGAWRGRWTTGRVVDGPTEKKNDSLWRTHCGPRWADWPMAAITREDAQAWVGQLMETRRRRHKGKPVERVDDDEVPFLSPATIHDIVHLMTALYKAAMRQTPPIVTVNPFTDLELPKRKATVVEFYEPAEAQALYESLELLDHGDRWRTMAELGMQVGLRPGEIYGLHGHRVDWIRGLIHVTHVMTEDGIREYPKSMKSRRTVPVPPDVLERMSRLMVDRPLESLVFTAPEGGPVLDDTWRDRVWYRAVADARMCTDECRGACDDPRHRIRRFPPRIMRHTAASWLVQDDVKLPQIQKLLGHEDYATTLRYAHLAPDAHDDVLDSWKRRSGA